MKDCEHELFAIDEYWMSQAVEVIMECGKCKQKFKGILMNYNLSTPQSQDQEDPGDTREEGEDKILNNVPDSPILPLKTERREN